MNLGQLREFLASLGDMPDETAVLLSSDEEGNSYRLADVQRSQYVRVHDRWTTRDGTRKEAWLFDCVAAEDVGTEYDPDDVQECILFW